MSERIQTAIAEDTFFLFGVRVRCYVLDDGRRIVNADDLAAMFESMATGDHDSAQVEAFVRWQRGVGGIGRPERMPLKNDTYDAKVPNLTTLNCPACRCDPCECGPRNTQKGVHDGE